MIRLISGKVVFQKKGFSIIQTKDGVGWYVNTGNILFQMGEEVEIFVYTQFKENEISLWGFKSSDDLEIFELLISVNGVGARIAHTLVNELGKNLILQSIQLNDPESLKISGVGLKTAQKIIFALKDKINNTDWQIDQNDKQLILNQNINEALDALEGLGYSRILASKVLKELFGEYSDLSTEEMIKIALKHLK